MCERIKIITKEGNKIFKCPQKNCLQMSERYFNIDRHFSRFHEKPDKPLTSCCSLTFSTKFDLHMHKEKVHNKKKDMKKNISKSTKTYTKGQKETIKLSNEIPRSEQQDPITKISRGLSEVQNNNNEISRQVLRKKLSLSKNHVQSNSIISEKENDNVQHYSSIGRRNSETVILY